MKKIILTLIFALIFFSCEEPIETVSETFPILSLNSQTEDVSINEMITITIHIKNLSAPIFGAYLEMSENHCISCFFRRGNQVQSRNGYQYTRKFSENVVKHNGNGGSENEQKSLMQK